MSSTLKKYTTIFALNWQEAFNYRVEIIVWRLVELIPVLVIITVWTGIYQGGQSIGGFPLPTLIGYYLVGYLIRTLVSTHFEDQGINLINRGEFSPFLLRPFSYHRQMFIHTLASKVYILAFSIAPLTVLLGLLFPGILTLPSISRSLAIIYFVIVGLILELILSLAIVATTFYFEHAKSLSHLKWMLNTILGGQLLPLSLFPENLEKWIRLLPFQYKFAVPVEFYLNSTSLNTFPLEMLKSLVWIVVFYLGMRALWHLSLKHYSSVGN